MKEADIQKQIVKYLRLSGQLVYSVPNELVGRLSPGAKNHFYSMGLTPGAADLLVLMPGGRVKILEVKTATGRQSDRQKEFERRCTALGHEYQIVRSLEDAVRAVGG
jgi:hypothetical protein